MPVCYFNSQEIIDLLTTHSTLLDFPRTADQRVYHLGVRPGEVANRIVIAEIRNKCFFSSVLISFAR